MTVAAHCLRRRYCVLGGGRALPLMQDVLLRDMVASLDTTLIRQVRLTSIVFPEPSMLLKRWKSGRGSDGWNGTRCDDVRQDRGDGEVSIISGRGSKTTCLGIRPHVHIPINVTTRKHSQAATESKTWKHVITSLERFWTRKSKYSDGMMKSP